MTVLIDYTKGFFETTEGDTVGTVTAGTETYDIANASYDSVSLNVASQDGSPKGIAFKSDGTRMFLTGSATDKVYQYDLSTAWDVSTASYNNVSAGIFTGGYNPWGINFKPDGTMMFLCGVASNVIQRINLSTAWDLSTTGNPSDRSLTGITSFPSGIVLKPDGTRFIIVSRANDTLYQFDCGTAWETENSTYNNVSFSVTNQATQPEGVGVNSDGTKLFVSCSSTDAVYQYSLSTAWDLSTASYDNISFSTASQDGTPSGVKFKPDGTKMYIVGDVNNTIYQYSTGTATTIDLSSGSVFSHTPSVNTTFAFTYPAASGTSSSATLKLTGATVVTGYDLANASYDSVSFSVTAQDKSPRGIFFRTDGLKLYMVGNTGDDVNEYTLTTAWDLSTASYLQNFSVSTQDTIPEGIFFKPDGTKMYIAGAAGSDINEYNLSTAWDISTASYLQNFSVSADEASPQDVFFRNDGIKMYIVGASGDEVNEYDLSTAWDISTASHLQNFSVSSQEAIPRSLSFNSDGTKMFVLGDLGNDVNEYSLSTAWDISTASYVQNFSVSAQETDPYGMFFKSDGTKMYIVGQGNDTIFQYTTGSSALATITYPASVIWSGGTTPTAPANGETDVYTFYTDDGGTTYYGFVSGDALA